MKKVTGIGPVKSGFTMGRFFKRWLSVGIAYGGIGLMLLAFTWAGMPRQDARDIFAAYWLLAGLLIPVFAFATAIKIWPSANETGEHDTNEQENVFPETVPRSYADPHGEPSQATRVSPSQTPITDAAIDVPKVQPDSPRIRKRLRFWARWKIALATLCVGLFGYQLFLAEGIVTNPASLAAYHLGQAVIVCGAFEAIFLRERYKSFRLSLDDLQGELLRLACVFASMFFGALIGNSYRAHAVWETLEAVSIPIEAHEEFESIFDRIEKLGTPIESYEEFELERGL